jgi:hypothetical protein
MRPSLKLTRKKSALAALALATSAVVSPALTGTAHAAVCNPGGGFGADPYKVANTVVGYGLIAWVDMPGCTTGVIDLAATAVPGTPGTCTLVLPMIPTLTDGAGCGIIYAPSGAALASSSMVIVAAGFAAGTSNVVPLVGTCGGTLGSSFPGPRCNIG